MRIALVVPGGVDRSGEQRVIPALLALITRLSVQHEVHVFALTQEPEPGEWGLAGARIHNIGTRYTRFRALRAICAQHAIARMDLVHSFWSGSCGMVAVAAAKILRIPSLIHIAGGELVALHDIGYGGRLTWRSRLRETLVLRGASAVTGPSKPVIDSLAALGMSATRVPLGVDLDVWAPRRPVRRAQSSPARLVHIASLNAVKDQTTLMRALHCLARSGLRFEMNVIGEDVLQGAIQALAGQLNLAHCVRFLGFMPQRQLRPYMEQAHLNIVSSRHEAGPLVVLEAAVAGVPTVGTSVGHIAEWAPDAALAVPVGDWTGLAGAIGLLLRDENRRMQLASEAWRRAIAEDATFTATRFEALYASLFRSQVRLRQPPV